MNRQKQLVAMCMALVSMAQSPSAVADDVQTIASWTFETAYAQDGLTYRPTADDFADVAATWFKDGAPTVVANEAAGDTKDYLLTAMSEGRYWQICTGYNNHVFRIENSTANAITDYTDGAQHNVYYEATFSTKGFENIGCTYAIAYGANAEAEIETVFSVDGGKTWVDGGSQTTQGNWWLYKENSVSLSAKDKDEVKVRLIAGNTFASNWNLDYLTISGSKIEAATAINASDATISWAFDDGVADNTTPALSTAGIVSAAGFSTGSNLSILSTTSMGGTEKFNMIQPVETIGNARDEASYVTFYVVPKRGLNYKLKMLTFNAAKFGTNGGAFDIVARRADKELTLAEGFNPYRPNDRDDSTPEYSAESYDISQLPEGADRIEITFYIYNLNNAKQVGLSDIVITADVDGTPEALPVYALQTTMGMAGAGNIISNPAGAEFDEGTEVSLTATENFGYHFVAWTDETGAEVSTANPYTFSLTTDTKLTAIYNKKNVYGLNVSLSEGANDNLVSFSPEGNVVDGIHHYEEGTEVRLSAISNRILTFTNWEDGTTQAVRDVKVNSDMTLEAEFSADDYIVGWDLYYDKPSSDRAADYKSDTENAGMLSLHNAEGTSTSWLTRGISNGQENGKYAARVWKLFSDGNYFEIAFSTVGWSNVVVSASLGYSYNTYEKFDVEMSTDGTTYTKVGEYDLSEASGKWLNKEIELPEVANNQARIRIRYVPSEGASIGLGASGDYDGLAIGEIFVLGESVASADDTAPVLLTTLPTDKSEGASATGSVILTFDEKVKAGEGEATMTNGSKLQTTFSGKTVVYRYAGLTYDTEYTLNVPKGAIVDRNGNAFAGTSITFRTMKRTEPEMRLFDAIVAQDGTGNYTSVQAAIDAAPAGRVRPWLIFVKNGKYNEHINIPTTKPFLSIIGQDRDKTIILDDKLCGGENALHVSVGATVVVNATDTYFENITLENSYGHEKQAGPQALALNTTADRAILNNVALLSYQDTWITTSTSNYRHYAKNCLIEGAVDFIYNSGNVYLDSDTILINRPSGGYIVAPSHDKDVEWGYVFMNNIIRPYPGMEVTDIWLGRPWHNFPKTVFINTQTFVNLPAKGWYNTMGGLPTLWADYNTVDANGNPVDLSGREDTYYRTETDGTKIYGTAKNYLTAEEAAEYTLQNVLAGSDNWTPDVMTEACAAPTVSDEENQLSWEAVPYAVCYIVERNGEVVDITTATTFAKGNKSAGDDVYTVRSVGEYGSLSARTIAGQKTNESETTTITTTETYSEVVSTEYYSVSGKKRSTPVRGINIAVEILSNGQVCNRKMIVK